MDRALKEQPQGLHTGGIKMEQRQDDAHHRDDPQHDPRFLRARSGDLGVAVHQFIPSINAIVTRARGAMAESDTVVSPTCKR